MNPRIILLALLVAAAPALATVLTAHQGADSVRLTEDPCTDAAVLAHLEPGAVQEFHAASAVFQGHPYRACWRKLDGGAYLLYEDGDQGVIRDSELHAEPEA